MAQRAGLPRPLRTLTNDKKRKCAECGTQILPGDGMIQTPLRGGRTLGWKHIDCRGRLAEALGFNASGAIKPAPKDWHTPPSCPECGALMTKSASGGHACHLSERHESREVVRINAQGWKQ